MSELWNSMYCYAHIDHDRTDQEELFSKGEGNDPGWSAYDQGVEKYSCALEKVLDGVPLQLFISSYCTDHNVSSCSIIDYMGTGVVRNLNQTQGVSVSIGHPPGADGNYIDGNLFLHNSWEHAKTWMEQSYQEGRIPSPYYDISLSRPLLGTVRTVVDPKPYAILLRRAYRLMHPERGIFMTQLFLDSRKFDSVFTSWKQDLKDQNITLTYMQTALRIDRHPGSPYNLPLPQLP